VFVCNSYNLFCFFYFLGIKGFPHGFWMVMEAGAELFLVLDLLIRFWCQVYHPQLWRNLWLIHDPNQGTLLYFLVYFLASVPSSIILRASYIRDDEAHLFAIYVALLRGLKLLRMP
jgi:hypothetical protein